MNEYIISFSFDKTNIKKQIMSGYANNVVSFVKNEFIDGYEMYHNEYTDEAIVKYCDNTYFVFPDILSL